jgi:hypothetical protein
MIDEEIDYCVMCHKPVYGATMCDECRADVIKRADVLYELDKKLEDNFGYGLDEEDEDDEI